MNCCRSIHWLIGGVVLEAAREVTDARVEEAAVIGRSGSMTRL